jgi:hypothetical protein
LLGGNSETYINIIAGILPFRKWNLESSCYRLVNVFPPTNTEKFLMKKAKENLSTLESTVIYFSLWRRWLYVYFLNSSLDIVAKK